MQDTREFDSIIQEIRESLTGDIKADVVSLNSAAERYRENPAIVLEIGRIIFSLLGEEEKAAFAEAVGSDRDAIRGRMQSIEGLAARGEYEHALTEVNALLDDFEAAGGRHDDDGYLYFDFASPFEEVLYVVRNEPSRPVRPAIFPYAGAYLIKGSVLIDLGRVSEARDALRKGLAWNPVSFGLTSEYMETLRMDRDLNSFFADSIRAFGIAYEPAQVARCFRNLAFCFGEKEQFSEAVACLMRSEAFEPGAPGTDAEREFIRDVTDGHVPEPDLDEISAYAERYGFPIGADPEVVSIAVRHGVYYLDQGQLPAGRYFLQIAYNLTGDPEVGKVLQDVNRAIEQGGQQV